jgi:hypothetical protein
MRGKLLFVGSGAANTSSWKDHHHHHHRGAPVDFFFLLALPQTLPTS